MRDNMKFRKYKKEDLKQMRRMWNVIIDGQVVGYYILHPNNIGRCSYVANASYVLDKSVRGKHLGKYLVEHSIKTAKELNFRGMQFNAVVESNKPAPHIYKSLGFKEVGMIPGGFMLKDGSYSNMYILYLSLL